MRMQYSTGLSSLLALTPSIFVGYFFQRILFDVLFCGFLYPYFYFLFGILFILCGNIKIKPVLMLRVLPHILISNLVNDILSHSYVLLSAYDDH